MKKFEIPHSEKETDTKSFQKMLMKEIKKRKKKIKELKKEMKILKLQLDTTKTPEWGD